MADALRHFFIDTSSTEYSYMFRYALSPGETPENPSSCVVVGWNTSEIGTFISADDDMHLFIPEVVEYNGREVSVIGIYDSAFDGRDSLNSTELFNRTHIKTVHLPNGITSIGAWAFGVCSNLVYINFPDTLINIGDNAFAGCMRLQTKTADGVSDAPTAGYLYIPWTVESIGNSFVECDSLTIVEIGSAANGSNLDTNTNGFSFKGCSNLKIFRYFYKNLEISISESCFEDCTNLTTVETPLGYIKSIGNKAFYNCQSLNNITQMEPVIDYLTGNVIYNYSGVTIGSEAFKNCTSLFRFPLQSEIISLGANAFQGCYYLQEINLGSSLTEIPEGAFSSCSSLGSITIPKNCTRIEKNAFYGCSRLRDIFIPSPNLVFIGDYAFVGCTNLQRLWLLASNYNDIVYEGSPFVDYSVNPNKLLILNSAFTQNWNESDFAEFETAFNTYWKVSPTKEAILFTPTTNNPNELAFILELNRPTFNSLTGTATIVGIVNQSAIETSIIDLPASVTSNGRTYTINKIGDKTFAYNYRISKIRIPNSITEIGNWAFESCWNLEEISSTTSVDNFPVTKIGLGAFAHCGKLSKINNTNNILNNLQYIGKDAFVCCNSLGKINLGTNYNGPIPERTFAYCGNLRVSKKSTTTYTTQSTSQYYDNTTFTGTTPTFVNI